VMKSNSSEYALFSGLVFWGADFLPKDIAPSLGNIREWAFKEELIWDAESQLVASERIGVLTEHFTHEDELAILIHLYEDSPGNLNYLEYPCLPVKSLIGRAEEIEVVYWRMIPTTWDSDGNVKGYGEIHFGFWYPGIGGDEFCSISNAKLVVKKFHDLFHQLPGTYKKNILSNGVLDIEVDGDVKAKFFKSGRLFDVELTLNKK